MKAYYFTTLLLLFSTIVYSQPAYVPQDGLMAWWGFNNSSIDDSQFGNNGQSNNVQYVSNRLNIQEAAVRFTGSNSFVRVDNSSDLVLNNNDAYSVSFWVKIESNPNNGPESGILSKWDEQLSSSYPIRIATTDLGNGESRLTWRIFSAQPSSQHNLDIILKNDCYHFITYVVSDYVCNLYVNSEFVSNVNFTFGNFDNNHDYFIGKRNVSAPRLFKGIIDEMGIWNRALSDEEIIDLYRAGEAQDPDFCCDFEKDEVVETVSTCSDFVWIDGNTYSESTSDPIVYLINSQGCDSIVQLDLTIYEPSETFDLQYSCGDFEWIDGNVYSESTNTPSIVLSDVNGCDSIVYLDLVILEQEELTVDHQTACNSFTWIDGVTYEESVSGVQAVLSSQHGCDSLVELDLTVYNSYELNMNVDTCNSYTWIDGVTYNHSTETSYILTDVKGCDSIVNLNLVINQPEVLYDYHCSFDSIVWVDGEVYFESTNDPFILQPSNNDDDCGVRLQLSLDIYSSNIIEGDDFLMFEESGFNYQWFDCDTDLYIPNATGQMFYPSKPGNYRVVATKEDRTCLFDSDCITFGTLSNDNDINLLLDSSINVFPNPTSGIFKIQVSDDLVGASLILLSPTGQVIQTGEIQSNVSEFDLSNVSKGVYYVQIQTQSGRVTKKLVKQ